MGNVDSPQSHVRQQVTEAQRGRAGDVQRQPNPCCAAHGFAHGSAGEQWQECASGTRCEAARDANWTSPCTPGLTATSVCGTPGQPQHSAMLTTGRRARANPFTQPGAPLQPELLNSLPPGSACCAVMSACGLLARPVCTTMVMQTRAGHAHVSRSPPPLHPPCQAVCFSPCAKVSPRWAGWPRCLLRAPPSGARSHPANMGGAHAGVSKGCTREQGA